MAMTVSELEEFLEAWRNATPERQLLVLEILRDAARRKKAEAKRKAEARARITGGQRNG